MREGAKRRLAGAVVIVALAAIFVPMLFEKESLAPPPALSSLPTEPDFENRVGSKPITDPALDPVVDSAFTPMTEEAYADLPVDSAAVTSPSITGAEEIIPDAAPAEDSRPTKPVRREPPAARPDRPTTKPTPPPPPKDAVASTSQPKTPDAGMSSWVIQVASLGTAQGAAELEKKLRNAGFPAFVEKAEVRGKQYYRVRVGPELSRANAERSATKLRQQQKLDTLIQRNQ
jgi:DedD protein